MKYTGIISESVVPRAFNNQEHNFQHPRCSMMLSRALYSSEPTSIEVGSTGSYFDWIIRFIFFSWRKQIHYLERFICIIAEAAKELHDKLIKSVVDQRTAPPNSLLWALIEKCDNREDIKLLFNVLENLRKFVSLFYSHLILF